MEQMINGFRVRKDDVGGEPRIQDIELAKRLGYRRPRDIRQLIKRLLADGKLKDSGARCTVPLPQTGAVHDEYWLDERSALKVIAKSETDLADDILTDVIEVFVRVRRHGNLRHHPLLAETMTPWDMMFSEGLKESLCKLYGLPLTKSSPRWLASVYRKLYRIVADKECYAEMKARNPDPRRGSNHHQLFDEGVRERFRQHLGLIEYTAKVAVTRKDFWQRLEASYCNRPMQLTLELS